MDAAEKVKSRWTRSFLTALHRKNDEEKYICDICQKDFANPSNLSLHKNTHVIERPYKCEPCQVSFNTQGHLQKHRRSSAHESRVTMTQAFGVPTLEKPRPYNCPECNIAFRKHGHLAKHLRSKSHITKLESSGLLPAGTYAAFEKSPNHIKDTLITMNSETSLVSLQVIATSKLGLNLTTNANSNLKTISNNSTIAPSTTPPIDVTSHDEDVEVDDADDNQVRNYSMNRNNRT